MDAPGRFRVYIKHVNPLVIPLVSILKDV
jgi:hypothetical protein